MSHTEPSKERFDFDAGNLCLDFANTADWHASQNPSESLFGYTDMVAWGVAAGLLSEDEARLLQQIAAQRPQEAEATYRQGLQLREAIFHIFSAAAAGLPVPADDLEILNQALQRSLAHMVVVKTLEGFVYHWPERPQALDRMFWPVARAAGDLLTSDLLERVGECADDRGCGYLFLDMSRNRSRRWCSMDSCGNRAKAIRHYERVRDLE